MYFESRVVWGYRGPWTLAFVPRIVWLPGLGYWAMPSLFAGLPASTDHQPDDAIVLLAASACQVAWWGCSTDTFWGSQLLALGGWGRPGEARATECAVT